MSELSSFGKYDVVRHVRTEGGCIDQYVARQRGMDREVELRTLDVQGVADPLLAERFLHEVKILAALDHPGVIPVLDQGRAEGRLYFTTALRRSKRLAEYTAARGGRLEPEEVLRFAEILTDAVAALHGAGLVHRAISPSSVYVDEDAGVPYLGECSAMRDLRQSVSTARGLPQLADLVPTPEGLQDLPLDARTDVFLLCRLFYELLGGAPAFADAAFRNARTDGFPKPTPLTDRIPFGGVTAPLVELLVRGLAADPSARPPTAAALADELRVVADRHRVLLLVQEEAARSGTVARPPAVVALAERRRRSVHAAAASSAAPPRAFPVALALGAAGVVVLSVALLALPGGSGGVGRAPVAAGASREVPAPPPGGYDAELERLALEVRAAPTTADTFVARMDLFRRWLAAQPAGPRRVCTVLEVQQVRFRVLGQGDLRACAQFDGWVAAAAHAAESPAPPAP